MLPALHNIGQHDYTGDGGDTEVIAQNAREYVAGRFKSQIARAIHGEHVDEDELATIQAAFDLMPAHEGEHLCPCHRDYCAANWLVGENGAWTGVIDFEFAHWDWDVRVADFSKTRGGPGYAVPI